MEVRGKVPKDELAETEGGKLDHKCSFFVRIPCELFVQFALHFAFLVVYYIMFLGRKGSAFNLASSLRELHGELLWLDTSEGTYILVTGGDLSP